MVTPYSSVVPIGATALRPSWDELAVPVRALVESREGKVVAAASAGAGFTPGFASVLTLVDGRQVFSKAADIQTRGMFADAYRAEASLLRRLPDQLPAPVLRWAEEVAGWVVLALRQ